MGTAAIVIGGIILLVFVVSTMDNRGAKLQARHSDVKKAKARLATARDGLAKVEDLVLSLETISDPTLSQGVLKIIRDTRKELDNTE